MLYIELLFSNFEIVITIGYNDIAISLDTYEMTILYLHYELEKWSYYGANQGMFVFLSFSLSFRTIIVFRLKSHFIKKILYMFGNRFKNIILKIISMNQKFS